MDHKKLDAWKRSMDLVEEVYNITKHFPRNEEFGLTSQIRRSAISVSSNIAEGAGRDSKKEYIRFLNISIASLSELETQLIIAQRLKYVSNGAHLNSIIEVRKLIFGVKKYLVKSNKSRVRSEGLRVKSEKN